MTDPVLRRSALFLPASNARALAKARTLPCDVVILDLEDAVAPDAKVAARAAAVAAVAEGGFGRRELVVRVNALSSDWGAEDCAALRHARPDAVLVPKVDDPAAVERYADRLGGVPVWAMVETARAVLGIADLAAARGLAALVMGFNDLALEMRATPGPDRAPFLPFLGQAVAAARANRLAILDAVYNAIEDADGLSRECEQGRAYGADGKTLIHPAQIAAANRAFAPDATAIAAAQAIVAAFEHPDAAGRGAIRLGGRMVERLHLEAARHLLAMAAAVDAANALSSNGHAAPAEGRE